MATWFLTGSIKGSETLALSWAEAEDFKIIEAAEAKRKGDGRVPATSMLRASNGPVVCEWFFSGDLKGTTVRMVTRPAWFICLGMVAFEYLGVLLALSCLFHDNSENIFRVIVKLFVGCAMVVIVFSMIRILGEGLMSLETSFWKSARKECDITLLTRISGTLGKGWGLSITLGGYIFANIFGVLLLGFWGLAAACLFIGPLLLVDVLQILLFDRPQWNWQLWVIENVTGWTKLMQAVIAVAFVLIMVEGLVVGLDENSYRMVHNPMLWFGQHRTVTPASAVILENDAKEHMEEWAKVSVGSPENVRKDFLAFLCRISPKVTAFLLLGLVIGVTVVVHKMVLGDIIKRSLLWRREVGKDDHRYIPYVPSLPEAWKWRSHWVTVVTVSHWLLGAVINIAACLFAVEGLSYMLTGSSIVVAEAAYVWSWIFAWSNMLFGVRAGRVVACVEVLLVALPFLMFCARLLQEIVRRFLKWLIVLSQQFGSTSIKSMHFVGIKDFISDLCTEAGIRKPLILFRNGPEVRVQVSRLLLTSIGILEISKEALDLLEPDELKAVIAHELGHLRHGLLLVSLLKALSLIALFPNYYMTLCVNWAKREMEADKFALQHIDKPETLRDALIKISAAELWSMPRRAISKALGKIAARVGLSKVRERVSELILVGRFFFGDGILGYTHPLLSERLAAIAAFKEELAG